MTVEELVVVEPDIWRTNALTGRAQATLEALENQVQKMQNRFEEVHNKVLSEEALLAELEANRKAKLQPQVLKKRVADAQHQLQELERKSTHLTYITQVENFNQDLVVVINKVNAKKKKLQSLVSEANDARALRKKEEKKTKDLKAEQKRLEKEQNSLEKEFQDLQDTVRKARAQLKKLDKKKAEYKAYCDRYEEKVLEAATDLNKIEHHFRKIDKTVGHNRKILRNTWQKFDSKRKQWDSLRYCDGLKQLLGKDKANKAKKDAQNEPIDLSKFSLDGKKVSSAVEEFLFQTSERKLKSQLAEEKKSEQTQGRETVRKRQSSFSPEVQNGPAEDPRLSKRRKMETKSQPLLGKPKKRTEHATVATQPTKTRKKKSKKKKKAKKSESDTW